MQSLHEPLPVISKNGESTWGPHSVFQKCGAQTNSPLCFAKMRSFFQLPNLFLQNVASAGTPHCAFEKYGVRVNSPFCFYKVWSPLEHSTVFLKNAEFTRTPPCLNSHSVFTKCGVQMNSLCLQKCGICFNFPPVFTKCGVHINSPLCFYNMWIQLQNAESTGTPHCAFKKCGVCINSPPCFYKMWSSHELPLCVFQQCGISFNFPPVFTKCGVHINSPPCFYNMSSHLEHSTVFLKNVEFTWTPLRQSLLKLPFYFHKMQSLLELPTVLLKNVKFVSTPHSVFTKGAVCLNPPLSFWKMRSSHELPLCRVCLNSHSVLNNAEFKWTPHSVLQTCGVCLNSPLSFYKMWSTLELPTALLKNEQQSQCHSQLSLQPLEGYPVCTGYSTWKWVLEIYLYGMDLMVNYFTPSLMTANFGYYTAIVKLKHLIKEFEFLWYV